MCTKENKMLCVIPVHRTYCGHGCVCITITELSGALFLLISSLSNKFDRISTLVGIHKLVKRTTG
jgi:hypothetical protein